MNPQAEGILQSRSECDPAKAGDFLRYHQKKWERNPILSHSLTFRPMVADYSRGKYFSSS
jgi:hypothetical protein